MQGKRILVLGNGSTRLAGATPALQRRDLRVERATSPDSALELAKLARIDLALIDYPTSGVALPDLLQGLAKAAPAKHRTHVVLVALPEFLEEARTYVGNGVAALIPADATASAVAQLFQDIVGAPPRVGVRIAVRLELALQEGTTLVFRQTQDLSATGMLVSTPHEQPAGTEASFRLDLPGARSPIEGRAQVVRHILDESGRGVRAVGMRFVGFKGDDAARLQSFVDSALPARTSGSG